jgi:hypothetical protein
MTPCPLEASDVRLLTEIGMVGAGGGSRLAAAVEQLFGALMVLRPERDFPYIGQASAYLNQARPDDAVRVLERGLRIMAVQTQAQDDRDMVRAFLGLALFMGRRTAEATATLQLLLREGQNPQALRMARGLMGLPIDAAHTEEIQ